MGNPASDPYAGLLARYQERRRDYVFRLTSDEETFQADPERNGMALRRGFLKGRGPRPVRSLFEQDQASAAAGSYLSVWTDNPALRAGIGEPWDDEDVHTAIARLWQFKDPDDFQKHMMIPEPPAADGPVPGFRGLLRVLRLLAVCGRGDFRGRIRTLLGSAGDTEIAEPDFNQAVIFESALVERVIDALHVDAEPDPRDTAGRDALVASLATRTLGNLQQPQIDSLRRLKMPHLPRIDASTADRVLNGLYALLPSALTVDLVNAALNAKPVAGQVPARPGWEPAPDSYERPPNAYEPPPNTYERPPNSYEPPPNSYQSPQPRKPRDANVLFPSVWDALQTLSWFGELATDSQYTVRTAALALAGWLRTGKIPEDQIVRIHRPSLIEDLFAGEVWTPPPSDRVGYPDFEWPPYTREGIYWWRAVIKSECVEHLFALKDTADFKSTDLIRLVRLFPEPDSRIPGYVRNTVKLALLWFKYWWDAPPAKNANGDDIAEMTMWSENHQILFAQSQLLAGGLYRDLEFARSQYVDSGKPRTGQDHIREGLARTERWLDFRLKFGFSEWNAPGYYNEDFPPLFNLVDFCDPNDAKVDDPDETAALGRIRIKAAMVLDLMIFDCARYTCRGSFGVTAGRVYWEHKAYGWEQSIGNTIEILFGTRGDYTGMEPAAVALVTSTYDVPQALLGIGLDRVLRDQQQPFIDRTRVSIDFDNAKAFGIGFDSEEDIAFWWGLAAYYTDRTIEGTKRVVKAHDNLRLCDPFDPLYSIANLGWMLYALIELASIALDALQVGAGVLLANAIPFPLNVAFVVIEADNILDGIADFFKDVWDYMRLIARSGPWKGAAEGAVGGGLVAGAPGFVVGGVAGFFGGLFGDDDEDKPRIPETALQELLEKLLVAFNSGTVLSTANNVTYSNGDAMLSSTQNHLPGQVGFQKQLWMASLGCEACVWTTARFMAPDIGSYLTSWERLFKDLGLLRFHEAVMDLGATPALQAFGKGTDTFKHDGPNYWTGSLALPLVVQHEKAAIIAYDLPALQRTLSGFSTHAWFPKQMFDETRKENASGGTWFFGRKDHLENGSKVGSGYVALFSAIEGDWTSEDGNAWNDKEIKTDPPGANVLRGSNIWICVVGHEAEFVDVKEDQRFATFCSELQNSYVRVEGVGNPFGLKCFFDVPRLTAPAGKQPTLELDYDDRVGKFAGENLELGNFPRFENQYMRQTVVSGPAGSGLRPQVERVSTTERVGFGSTGYTIQHPTTGLTLEHDTARPARRHSVQDEAATSVARRLVDGSLPGVRGRSAKPRRAHPWRAPKLDRSGIRRRTP
jgi:hypothetical protein